MSGTRISTSSLLATVLTSRSDRHGVGLFGIDPEFLDRAGHSGAVELAVVRQCLERRDHDVAVIDFEEPSQRSTRIAAPIAIGTQYSIGSGHPLPDLVSDDAHVISRGDERALLALERLLDVRHPRGLVGMQQVPAF